MKPYSETLRRCYRRKAKQPGRRCVSIRSATARSETAGPRASAPLWQLAQLIRERSAWQHPALRAAPGAAGAHGMTAAAQSRLC